jgi:hypothetical protein
VSSGDDPLRPVADDDDDLVLPEGQYSVEDLGHWRVGLADVRRGRHDVGDGDGDSLATANRRRFGVD